MDPDGDLLLRRVQARDGRTRAFINDQPVSIGLLRQLGDLLVEIHGQHDERGLLDASGHRALLDIFGGLETKAVAVRRLWAGVAQARDALQEHQEMLQRAQAEQDYLRHVAAELDELAPEEGEEARLAEERILMMSSEKVAADLTEAQDALSGNGGLEARLSQSMRRLSKAAEQVGGRLDASIAALDRMLNEAADARDELDRATRALEFDPLRLEQSEARLFALRAAARKHNVQPDQLASLAEKFRSRLNDIEDGAARLEALKKVADEARAIFLQAAKELSALRVKAAAKLDQHVMKELKPLKLDKAVFKTNVEQVEPEAAGPDGFDRVSFLISTNPGAPLGPLIKIASGGELSRFILALKVSLASQGSAPTLIFDEVDSGVGGAVAEAVGLRLADLSGTAQILVVTHSPQVAARASYHLRISKGEMKAKGAQLSTRVDSLDSVERLEEIARMLAGATVTDEARAAAAKLIGSHR